ncbi:hypothetical protein EDB87DRAFT_1574956 [Lactarius vividus]|nr:hypothetical protein EDB87DRAFT_1574956 [Lactarius vividus]
MEGGGKVEHGGRWEGRAWRTMMWCQKEVVVKREIDELVLRQFSIFPIWQKQRSRVRGNMSRLALQHYVQRMYNSEGYNHSNLAHLKPSRLTQVDLGEVDEDEESTRTRYSSLPPTPTQAEHKFKEARHQSLPPLARDTEPSAQLPSLEEVGENDCSTEEMVSSFTKDGNSTKEGAGTSSETGAVQNDERLRASHGAIIPRSITGIKKEAIKTCWFMVWNEQAISRPPVLHSTVQLELGDLFINQFYSARHGAQVLQVWLLVPTDGSTEYRWKQVRENEKTYHPKLKNRTLAFQPN